MAKSYVNTETFILPSKGRVYSKQISPSIELRSMTTEDEEKRLRTTATPNKLLSELIEGCIVGEKPAIHVYDMCLGDFNFLLHKLRLVTYGSEYKMDVTCPHCRQHSIMTADLDSLEVNEYDDSIENDKVIELPVTGKKITLKMNTPRDIDEINARVAEIRKRAPESIIDPTFKVSLQFMIDLIDGEKPSPLALEKFVTGLPMRDANYLRQKSAVYNGKVGLNTEIAVKCSNDQCGFEFLTSFRYGDEFFRPTVD